MAGTRQLVGAVVEEHIRDQGQCIALIHVDIAEGIEGVGLLVVEGAVAGEDDIIVTEADMTHKDLGIAVQALVVVELIRVQQMDKGAFLSGLGALLLGRRKGEKGSLKQEQHTTQIKRGTAQSA